MEKHPAAALTSQMTQLLDAVGRIPVTGLSGAELDAGIEEGLTVLSRVTVHLAALIEQAQGVDRPAELAAPSLVAWLRGRFGLTPRDASRLVRDMKALRAAPVAAEAALLGAIPVQAAAAIGQAVGALPPEIGPELRAQGEDVLRGFAIGRDGPQLHTQELALVGRHLHEVLDPDAADELLAARLEREEAATYRRRFLSITDDHDGGVRLRGLLTTEAGAILRAVLDPLAAPRPAAAAEPAWPALAQPTDPATDRTPRDPEAGGPVADSAAGNAPSEPQQQDELRTDERTGGQRWADALVEVAERALASGELPTAGGQRPQLIITVDHDQLAHGVGAGVLPDGSELSPATVRRLACDAGIIPAVLGSNSQVLDLGRSTRTATPAQRKALTLRDGGCAVFQRHRAPAVIGPPGGPRLITSNTWSISAPPTSTIWSCSADITTETSTTTAGRPAHPKTASDRCSCHPPGSTPNADPQASSAPHPRPPPATTGVIRDAGQ